MRRLLLRCMGPEMALFGPSSMSEFQSVMQQQSGHSLQAKAGAARDVVKKKPALLPAFCITSLGIHLRRS
jgi:hypothetical protein